jgi:hypothetical protein
VKEGLIKSCFHIEILEFQSYSKHRNHFDIDLKQTRSEEIQMIPIERFSKVMKTFCFAFGEKYEVTFGWSKKDLRFNLRVTKNRSSKHSFYLHE